jgi:hypothetical protein
MSRFRDKPTSIVGGVDGLSKMRVKDKITGKNVGVGFYIPDKFS